MQFEEPINRRVMRQYLIGPTVLGVLWITAVAITLTFQPFPNPIKIGLLIGASALFLGVVVLVLRSLFQELLEAKDHFGGIFSSMLNLVIVTESSGKVYLANKAALEKLGYSELSIKDLHARELIGSEAKNPFRNFDLTRGAGDYAIRDFETAFIKKDGETIPVLLFCSPLLDSVGKVKGAVIVAQDLTEIRKARDDSQKMQAQLVQASKLASLGTIGSGVAHELNNPLTIVKASAEIILENLRDPDSVQESVSQILHSANRMKKITDHLRTFARESKKDDWEQLDVNVPVRHSLVLLQQKFKTENICLNLKLSDELPVIWGDSNQLESVFQNLLTNSRDAFDEIQDGRTKAIDIETRVGQEGGVHFIYRDNAGGMAPETLERIFDPFFTTKGVGKGTGLGMSILHGIIQKHRGKLDVESQLGEGTQFTIHLPPDRRATRRRSSERRAPAVPATEPVHSPKDQDLPKILIVDDEVKIAQLLRLMLKSQFDVKIAEDAEDGMRLVEKGGFDLVVTDLQMPKYSGIEIIDAVKRLQPETPVVLMSGNGDGDAKVQKALARGAVGVLDKPFKDPKSVQDYLQACLTESRAA